MRRTILAILLAAASPAGAQIPTEAPTRPSPQQLFTNQCGICHVLHASDGKRQGPPLAGVVGRKPGSVEGFKYSPNYANADFVWNREHLDKYLTNPQSVIPGSVMVYRQANANTRGQIISYLEEQQ